MSLSEIEYVLKKCKESGIEIVSWQGGEPLIHTQIEKIIDLHKKYNMKIMIFSNGIFNKDIIPKFKDILHSLVLNFNHENSYKSSKDYDIVMNNINEFQKEKIIDKLCLGYNLYDINEDYSFFINTIKEFNIKEVRCDMVRPSSNLSNCYIEFKDINTTFNYLKEFIEKCKESGALITHLDCPFPICQLSEDNLSYAWKHFYNSSKIGACFTTVDISSGLMLSSCFCSLNFENISLDKFNTLEEAQVFLEYCEHDLRWKFNSYNNCEKCKYKAFKICQGGCLGYSKNNNIVNEINLNKIGEFKNYFDDSLIKKYHTAIIKKINNDNSFYDDLEKIEYKLANEKVNLLDQNIFNKYKLLIELAEYELKNKMLEKANQHFLEALSSNNLIMASIREISDLYIKYFYLEDAYKFIKDNLNKHNLSYDVSRNDIFYIYKTLGAMEYRKNNLESALNYYRKALDCSPPYHVNSVQLKIKKLLDLINKV